MSAASPTHLTELLVDWGNGNQQALDQLLPLVYDELHRLAHSYLRQERPDHTLQTTALINEAYVRLVGWEKVNLKNRAHFLVLASQVMRHILVDYARIQSATKRFRKDMKLSLEEAAFVAVDWAPQFVALNDALAHLTRLSPQQGQIVELRFFGGLTVEEIAETLNISPRTVKREWSMARAWLLDELRHDT
ncbi:MAG TPA: sigma-70 family RNA polymerase sigma factor [Acidobacteriota bacterium]|nr:sigma-70 family RNA polymerase sigma factor [Acidobacteriota bacterium]